MEIAEEFKLTKKLYHFTKFESAIKIITSRQLWFSNLRRMNDGHENSKIIFGNGIVKIREIEKEIYKYQQISLTQDTRCYKGFELMQMWGLYADNCRGVCLVFDKDSLIKECTKNGITYSEVRYDYSLSSDFASNAMNVECIPSEIEKNLNTLFYHKSRVWEHEQEFRLIKRCNNDNQLKLNIHDSLKFVILFGDNEKTKDSFWGSPECIILKKISNVPVLGYGCFMEYALSHEDNGIIWSATDGYNVSGHNENYQL